MTDGVAEAARDGLNHTIDNDGVANNLPDLIAVPGTVSFAGATGAGGAIATGDHIVWSVTVRNDGDAATPAGLPEPAKTGHLDVLYRTSPVTDGFDNWEDRDAAPLAVAATRVETADGGSNGVNYWIAGPAGDYTLTVIVNGLVPPRITESDISNNTLTYDFTVDPPTAAGVDPPNITNEASVPDGVVGRATSFQFLSTGTQPEVWTVPSGTLPAGMVLESTGLYHGTPTAVQTANFAVRATGPTGLTDTTATIGVNIAAVAARQEVAWWGGITIMDNAIAGAGGLHLSDLASRGITKFACSRGAYSTDNPSWLRSEYATVKAALGSVGAGFHMANTSNALVGAPGNAGVPTTNGQADSIVSTYWTPLAVELVAAGGTFFSIDPEPYGWPSGGGGPPANSPWSTTYTTAAVMTHFGGALGAVALAHGLGFEIYIASNCWWNPSNQYEIALQNGEPSTTFDDRLFDYFVHGLVASGATVNIMDAAFQHPGLPNSAYNDSYTQAVDHIVALTDTEFGAGVVGNNIMPWPWNAETGGVWDHSSLRGAVDEATLAGSGPLWIYDGDLPGGYTLSDKIAWLDDVKAGLGL